MVAGSGIGKRRTASDHFGKVDAVTSHFLVLLFLRTNRMRDWVIVFVFFFFRTLERNTNLLIIEVIELASSA